MAEKGSDEMFAELADLDASMHGVLQDDQRRAEEEERVSYASGLGASRAAWL